MTLCKSPWEQFASYENFLLAWQRTVNVSSRMVSDELGLETFSFNLEANLRDLVRQVGSEYFPYCPASDHKVYVPKASTTLRTMSVLSVPDLVVYQALVNVVADQASTYLASHENQHVYGNIYAGPGKRWMLKPWAVQYGQYVRRVESLFASGNTWIASTDIVAFYDTIDHQRLLAIVGRYCGGDSRFLELLKDCLSKWSAHNSSQTMSRGIPQGSNASDFLANLFLFDIDRTMIVQGYNYVRYVDDVRILAEEKSIVQRGLILFDLELKRTGLVAQVSKTSVHEIVDIGREIYRLQFAVTNLTDTGEIVPAAVVYQPYTEQAATIGGLLSTAIENEASDQSEETVPDIDGDETEAEDKLQWVKSFIGDWQEQLYLRFLESFSTLDNPQLSKESESNVTYCLNRLEPMPEIKEQVISLLTRLPWRSETVTRYLGHYKGDAHVADELRKFIMSHDVYSWHRANCLWALYNAAGQISAATICRGWLSDVKSDWYARTIAARILRNTPNQHAFLLECLKREQALTKDNPEETSILRAEIAFGAFHRIKSYRKQFALLNLICSDSSPLVNRLLVYLLQHPDCKVTWEDLRIHHTNLSQLSELVKALGISSNTPEPCFLAQTMQSTYEVQLPKDNLKGIYNRHYEKAITHLRESVRAYHKDPSRYVREFHQFMHITLLAFYESHFPEEQEIYEGYARLTDRAIMRSTLPKGVETWKRLGSLRNQVDHPVDKKTKSHTKPISVKEAEDLYKELRVGLQELFDVWMAAPTPNLSSE